MRLKYKSFQGKTVEENSDNFWEIIPCRSILFTSQAKAPYCGFIHHRTKVFPVIGPMPTEKILENLENLPWLLIEKTGTAKIICGLPEIIE